MSEVASVYRRHVGGVSDEMWKSGEYHHEKFRPNNIWMYWLLSKKVLPHACVNVIECRIRVITDYIIRYGATRNNGSTSRDKLIHYIYSLVLASKPPCVSDEEFLPGTWLREIIDSQVDSYCHMRRYRRIWSALQKIKNSLKSMLSH